jgi:hypothetical protein
MARRSLWEVLVDSVGLRRARRLAGFLECWALTEQSWQEEPSPEQLTVEWGYTDGEIAYFIREFRLACPLERSPTELMRRVQARCGEVGIDALRETPEQVATG